MAIKMQQPPRTPAAMGAVVTAIVIARVVVIIVIWLGLFLAMFMGVFTIPILIVAGLTLVLALFDVGLFIRVDSYKRTLELRQTKLDEEEKASEK
jgi:hypothetical protein